MEFNIINVTNLSDLKLKQLYTSIVLSCNADGIILDGLYNIEEDIVNELGMRIEKRLDHYGIRCSCIANCDAYANYCAKYCPDFSAPYFRGKKKPCVDRCVISDYIDDALYDHGRISKTDKERFMELVINYRKKI